MNHTKTFKENIKRLGTQERYRFKPDLIPSWFGEAAVLILFWDDAETIKVVLTERSSKVSSHKGEVSFPGGRKDDGESLVQTSLREAEEEIGTNPEKVDIIGRLDDGWSRAAYHLIPFVGWYNGIPEFTANTDEVGKILTPDINELFSKDNREEKTVERNGIRFLSTTIRYQGSIIFGLTADLLLETLEQGTNIYTKRGKRREESLTAALNLKSASKSYADVAF